MTVDYCGGRCGFPACAPGSVTRGDLCQELVLLVWRYSLETQKLVIRSLISD